MKEKWILLRGLVRGNGHWGDFPKRLLARHPGIQLELLEIPGNGTRHQETTPLSGESVVTQIRESSDILRGGGKVHLCGISLGGMIALKWAELFPEDLHSVTAINSSLSQVSPLHHRFNPGLYGKVLGALFSRDFRKREKVVLEMTSNAFERAEEVLEDFQRFSEEHPLKNRNFFRQLLLAKKMKLEGAVTVPTKIISAAGDRLVNPKCSSAISELLGVEHLIHPSAGHDLPLDDPDWLVEALLGTYQA